MGEMLIFAGFLALGGVAAGFMAGLLGVGGGAVLVPVLYEVFGFAGVSDDIRTHMAVATSLAVILPTGIRSAMGHNAKGSVDWDVVRVMGPAVIIGVAIGTLVAKVADGTQLRWLFGVMGLIMGLFLLWSRGRDGFGFSWPGNGVVRGFGVFNGLFSTLMGIGGGTFTTTFMTIFGHAIHKAVGTASAIGPIIALPAMLGFIWAGWGHELLPMGSLGFVSVVGAALILPTSLLMAPLGVRAAHGLSRSQLQLVFAVFLLMVGVRFLWSVMV